ncbi:hypothetical protein AAFF_G00112630 [Aldrovandia affinis]|uniref:Uncharacterized protein n=1 Tax=Aldrovandia affinis TaxID=143900 RepID=A0AAD7RTC3_9TELE|nr:hypothetical protein AAFF_G00112630 [Aldrovandia affinis]
MDVTTNIKDKTVIHMNKTTTTRGKSSMYMDKTTTTRGKTDIFVIKTNNKSMITISTRKTSLSREEYIKRQVIWNLSLAFEWLPFSVQPMHLWWWTRRAHRPSEGRLDLGPRTGSDVYF